MDAQQQQPNGKQKRKRVEKRPIEPVPEDPEEHAGNSKLARALGSVDYHSRHKGVLALTRFLQRKKDLQRRDMLKIWKGLFYAFWHSDKAPVQEELADRLAAVLSDLKPQVAFMYFTCFLRTMRREWFGIDRLRLDKFLMLIRKFMCRMFKVLSDSQWNKSLVTQYMDFLHHHVLLPTDNYHALGITYHVADIFVPELKGMAAAAVEAGARLEAVAVPADVLPLLLQPLCKALAEASDAPMVTRIKEGAFDAIVDSVPDAEDDDPLCHLDASALASELFTLGAQQSIHSRNRQALYAISSALERAQVKRQRKEGATGGPGTSQPANTKRGDKAAAKAGSATLQQEQPSSSAAALADASGPETAGGSGPNTSKKKRKASLRAAGSKAAQLGTVDDAEGVASGSGRPAHVAHVSAQGKEVGGSWATAPLVAAGMQALKVNGVPTGKANKAKLVLGPGAMAVVPGDSARGSRGGGAPGAEMAAPGTQLRPQLQAVHHAAVRQVKSAMKAKAPVLNKDGKKRESNVAFAGAETENGDVTPKPAGKGQLGGSKAGAGMSSAKKKVQINLRKNLYFEFGGPVPPAEVRTPQTARSKGGILKKKASMVVPRSAPAKLRLSEAARQSADLRLANASHSAEKLQQRDPSSWLKPARAKAALFF